MAPLTGRYFYPQAARCIPTTASVTANMLQIIHTDGSVLADVPLAKLVISPRLGELPRKLYLPDGAQFECADDTTLDALLLPRQRGHNLAHRLEQNWPMVLVSLILSVGLLFALLRYGVPQCATILAHHSPPQVAVAASNQALTILEKGILQPTHLAPPEQARAQWLFVRTANAVGGDASRFHLLLRFSPTIGPNAFALPDGRIVMTDALWKRIHNPDEVEGVFAHEMAHVTRTHGLQKLYEASILPALLILITGDASQAGQIFATLPTVLLQAGYGRSAERQADSDAIIIMHRLRANPMHLAGLLLRLEAELCGKKGCAAGWFGDHPPTRDRVQLLRDNH